MQNSKTLELEKDSEQEQENNVFVKEKYLNRVQMYVIAICAKITVLLWGRRTGKTAGAVALSMLRCVHELPRSIGFFAGKSYQKILAHMLPELITVWQDYGMVYDSNLDPGVESDFCIGKKPPAYYAKPLVEPASYKNIICWKNGTIVHLIGFDHRVTSNAIATDWGVIDEAKQQPVDRIDKELLPTMSGHYSVYGDHPCHRSLLLSSDGNIGPNDFDWIGRYKELASDNEKLYRILMLQNYIQSMNEGKAKELLTKELHSLQNEAVLYLEAATYENLEILGIGYFRDMARTMPANEFLESLGNERGKKTKGAFYKFLDDSIHAYSAPNYHIIDNIGTDYYLKYGDCREDLNWDVNKRIKIGVDFGGTYSWAVIGQFIYNTYYITKCFWVEHPFKTQHLAQKIVDYCKAHKFKTADFAYDPGGNKKNASTVLSDVEYFTDILVKNEWTVVDLCEGKDYIDHADKYRIYEEILNEIPGMPRDVKTPKFRINEIAAQQALYSMQKADLKKGEKGYEKDKSSEKKKTLDQWKATHLSDAVDNIICFENADLVIKTGNFDF